jgi:sugar phosphate permease
VKTDRKALYYGWVVTGVCFLSVGVSVAIRQSLIIFFPSLLEKFGWSRAALSVAPSLSGFIASFFGLIIGILSDKWDVKKILISGAVVAALGLLLCTTTRRLWQIYLFFGLITSIGIASLGMLPNTIILSNWFMKRRGMTIGIVASSYGAGTLILMPLLQAVINQRGWRFGFIFLAFVVTVLIPIILIFQKSHPPQRGIRSEAGRDDHQAKDSSLDTEKQSSAAGAEKPATRSVLVLLSRNRRFWFAYAQFILGPLATMPIIAHQAAFFIDKGFDKMTTAMVVGIYGFGTFLGMLISGYLSDRLSREVSYTIGTVSLIVGCVILLMVRVGSSVLLPVCFGLFFGLGFGTRPSMDAATASDLFSGQHFGLIYGLFNTGLGLGFLFGPVLSGWIFDTTGSYMGAIIFCLFAVSVATACSWLAAPRHGNEYEVMISR